MAGSSASPANTMLLPPRVSSGAVLEQANVVGLHAFQLFGQPRGKAGGVGKAAEVGETGKFQRIVGQRLGLLVGQHLEAMLDAAQEPVGTIEVLACVARDPGALGETVEGDQRLGDDAVPAGVRRQSAAGSGRRTRSRECRRDRL